MKLTIAIPSYNKKEYIERCVKSALVEQSHTFSIRVVDNCSTDGTFELAQKFEPDVKCHQNDRNLGMSGNFNKCIELCDGDWLMILHADDELLPNSIERYKEMIEKNPSLGLIHADSYSVLNGDESTRILHKQNHKSVWKAGADALSCPYGVCSAVMVRKEAYDKLGNFIESSLSSDVEMWARIAGSYDIGYINEPTVTYHVNPHSTGPHSLTNRSVKEIRADWDMLDQKIAASYPTQEGRDLFLKKSREAAPGSYWAVLKANIRARNLRNVIDALFLILFTYKGGAALLRLVCAAIVKRVRTWL